ncbi:MAG: inositol monophosphatase [Candidatus Coatesbacteria bacterium]|nr:inositol monophosphatase [Candidatus Coatesbacteria bacterium]
MSGSQHSIKQRFSEEFNLAKELARNSGKILLANFGKRKELSYKGVFNLVTESDEASERSIISSLKRNYPNDSVLTEESQPKEADPERRWIIDPLDGTNNYAHNFPIFCVSIAFEYWGKIIIGIVYNPVNDEMFSAVKDSGAYLNTKMIKVSSTEKLVNSLLATGFPYDRLEGGETNIEFLSAYLMKAQGIRRTGSAALDLCFLASGRIDGYWELKLSPWDTAAGALIVKEAGGKISCLDGSEWNPFKKEILASNSIIHDQMIEVAKSVPRKVS